MTKFVAYVAQILLCESCKFGEKIFYSNWDNEFFLRDCFLLAHPVGALNIGLYMYKLRDCENCQLNFKLHALYNDDLWKLYPRL